MSLPEPFKESLRAWRQGEWFRVGLDEDIGGVSAPAMVAWAINELPLGANPPVFLYMAGPIMADILHHIGNEQQRHWAQLAIERNWAATMVLTEPDAGSDVGAGRTKASARRPTAPGTSTASSGSSPTVTPTMRSRTSCIWCSPDRRVPGREPRA